MSTTYLNSRALGLAFALFLSNAAFASQQIDPRKVLLPEGTEITLELYENVSSKRAITGAPVELSAWKEIQYNGTTVIKAGRYGAATIKKIRRAGVFGAPGVVSIQADRVEAVNGADVELDGIEVEAKGRNRRALAWLVGGLTALTLMVLVNPAFFPAILLGLFIKGKEAGIPARTRLVGRVRRDTILNL